MTDVVSVLRSVPEKRLRIFALAEQLRTPDGTFDYDAAAESEDALQLAESEAELYSRATQAAVTGLRRRLLH